MGFSLSKLTGKSKPRGSVTTIHSTGGVGKSTLGVEICDKNNGFMILGEDGIGFIDTEVPRTDQLKTWKELLDVVVAIVKEEHEFKSIVIDTIDSLMPSLDKYVVDTYYGGDNSLANAYKAKYSEMSKEFGKLLKGLRSITRKGIDVYIMCHSVVSNYRSPDSEVFQRWVLNLPGGAKTNLGAQLYDFSDFVFFANRNIVVSDGRGAGDTRVLHTQWNPSWDAKSRCTVAEKILMSYDSIKKEIGA